MSLMFALLAAAATLPPSDLGPTATELAKMLSDADGQELAEADIRNIACVEIEEEPTERWCRWEQKDEAGWAKYSVYAALDASGWLLIDSPTHEDEPD